ncbi:MAG: DUF3795 domain-containing protein [Thermodesulfobacteriota bacterium]|nr:DUF3795 domain-containing protein [Thermodesulfobacteriota bacterium]
MPGNDSNLIAYCGLYCGDCSSHQGTIADLARDLRKELRRSRFDKTAEALSAVPYFDVFQDYGRAYEVLGAMVKFRCKKACRSGGGPPFCKIRKCCQKKGFEGCWECGEFQTCEKLDFLKPSHGGAHIKNLRKIKKSGQEKFIEGKRHWYAPLKATGK